MLTHNTIKTEYSKTSSRNLNDLRDLLREDIKQLNVTGNHARCLILARKLSQSVQQQRLNSDIVRAAEIED